MILLFFCFLSITGKSQGLPISFDDCKTDVFFAVVDEKPTFNTDSLNISDYFNKNFKDKKVLENFSGKIVLGILIFEDGKPCCKSFTNMTAENIKPELFQKAVNNMPYWTPAKQKNKAVPFLMQLLLNFQNGKVVNP